MKSVSLWRRATAVALSTLIALTAAACGGAGGSSSNAGSGEIDPDATLRINLPVSSSLNPTEISIASLGMISLWPVYDRLVEVDADNEYAPMLAESWSFSEDGTALSFTLREGVTFSDGEPFDATAAKTSLDFLRSSDSSSSSGPLAGIDTIEAPSATELVLRLKAPSTAVLGALATPNSGAMISPKAIDGGDLTNKPVGTGAWEITSFKPGVEVVYERRADGIWDENSGKVKTVKVATFTSAEARTNAIRSGQYDLTTYAGTDEPALGGDIDSGNLQLNQTTGLLMYTIFLNTTKAPFDDVRVRQAVNYALDRKNLAAVIDVAADPRVQPYAEGLLGFDEDLESQYGRDVDKAKDLLAEAGHADGIDGGEILVANTGGFPELAQAVQANLKEAGIDIDLKPVDVAQVNAEWAKGDAQGMMMYQSPPDLEAISFFERNYRNAYWWVGGPLPEVEKLLDGIGDPRRADDQEGLVQAVNGYATDNALFAPILQKPVGYVAAPKVRNFERSPFAQFGGADFRFVYLEK